MRGVEGIQSMLDLWEPLNSNSEGSKVTEIIMKTAADMQKPPTVKIEELKSWGWDDSYKLDIYYSLSLVILMETTSIKSQTQMW